MGYKTVSYYHTTIIATFIIQQWQAWKARGRTRPALDQELDF